MASRDHTKPTSTAPSPCPRADVTSPAHGQAILVVQRTYWRLGAGRALVESVEEWAKHRVASLLKVGTYARSPAVAFYEALGYGRRSIIFEKYLE